MESFEISYEARPDLGRSVYWAYLWRAQAVYFVSSLLLAALATWRIALGASPWRPFWTFCLGSMLTLWWVWYTGLVQTRRSLESVRGMVRLAIDDAGCTVRTDEMSSWVSWRQIVHLLPLKPAVLVIRRHSLQPLVIPRGALTDEQFQVLCRHLRASHKNLG